MSTVPPPSEPEVIEDPLGADVDPTEERPQRTIATPEVREKGLAGFAQRLAGWTEKWFPDAFIFALAGVVLIVLAAIINGIVQGHAKSIVPDVFRATGSGFWDLMKFSLQMAMVVLTGYVVATSEPMRRFIEKLALWPRNNKMAVAYVALLSMLVSYLSWGLSLVFAGLLARAIARRKDIRVDYKAIGAAAFMGLGAVWALGISSSAAQLQATPASMPPELLKITGVLDFGKTIFTWQAHLLTLILWLLTTAIAYFSAPSDANAVTAADMGVDLDDTVETTGTHERPGEYLEYKWYLPAFMGVLILGWIITDFYDKFVKSHDVLDVMVKQMSDLNAYLMVFLVLGMVLHKTPRNFMAAVGKAIPSTAGVLVQFPLYAVMAKVLTLSPGGEGSNAASLAHLLSSMFTGVGHTAFPIVLAIYTGILGILVPSGGGKWIVEAPYVMSAANDLKYNLGWTVEIYNVAEALPNLINPFFMLPLLAILKVRARDLVGYTFVQFLFHLPVILFLVWALGATFQYIPPIMPPK